MRSVGTLIFERPRPLSRQRRANHLYTLICEEPNNIQFIDAVGDYEYVLLNGRIDEIISFSVSIYMERFGMKPRVKGRSQFKGRCDIGSSTRLEDFSHDRGM